MKQKNQYTGQDLSKGNFECPDCGNQIPLDFRHLFSGGKVVCSCGLVLRVNLEKSRETIETIKESQVEISRATKGQFEPF